MHQLRTGEFLVPSDRLSVWPVGGAGGGWRRGRTGGGGEGEEKRGRYIYIFKVTLFVIASDSVPERALSSFRSCGRVTGVGGGLGVGAGERCVWVGTGRLGGGGGGGAKSGIPHNF